MPFPCWPADRRRPGLHAVGKVVRRREVGGRATTETAYFPLGCPLTPERPNEVARHHWGVENRLQGRLDVVINEDRDRTRLGDGPHNVALLRHMARDAMQKEGSKGFLRGTFERAGWSDADLSTLSAHF